MEYHLIGYRENCWFAWPINNDPVSPRLSTATRLTTWTGNGGKPELIPRHHPKVPIQAAIGSKVTASEHIPLYGRTPANAMGDISRKKNHSKAGER